MRELAPELLQTAQTQRWPPHELLTTLVREEIASREASNERARLKAAGFPAPKTLDSFDLNASSLPRPTFEFLASLEWLQRKDNLCLAGPAGVGKSHLAQALGHRACRAGFTVAYVGAHEFLVQLRAARGDGSYEKRLFRFTTPDVLIIDDLGLRGLAQDEPADLYEIVRRRYEHGSTIITSNRAIEEWPPMFGNPLLASAAMDRLLHHAHVLVIEGDSYRNPPPTRKKRAQAAAAETAR
jgi:DNA replication protein DnaC